MSRTRTASIGALACALGALAFAPTATPSVADGLCLPPNPAFDPGAEKALRGLTNAFRASQGLRPLRPKAALTAVARQHSRDMAAGGYFQHSNVNGRFPWAGGRAAGENLALADTPQQAMSLLSQSPTHRHTLLSSTYRRFGIGAMRTCTGALLITQDFLG